MKLFLLLTFVVFTQAVEETQNRSSLGSGFPIKIPIFGKGISNTTDSPNEVTEPSLPSIVTAPPKKEDGRLSGIGRDIIKKAGEGIQTAINKGKSYIPSSNSSSLDSIIDKVPGIHQIGKAKNEILKHANSIYPGTKWCGGGNISKSDDDLGLFAHTDACCREHDMCPHNIAAGATENGLYNNGLFTRSHCDCDVKFYDCLLSNSKTSLASSQLGVTYFNILGPQCYREDYPILSCLNTTVTASNLTKCTEYELDTTAQPVYQWFDNKLFWGVPLISG